MAHEGLQIDADERGGHQADDRPGADTSAHARLAEEACAPGMLVRDQDSLDAEGVEARL